MTTKFGLHRAWFLLIGVLVILVVLCMYFSFGSKQTIKLQPLGLYSGSVVPTPQALGNPALGAKAMADGSSREAATRTGQVATPEQKLPTGEQMNDDTLPNRTNYEEPLQFDAEFYACLQDAAVFVKLIAKHQPAPERLLVGLKANYPGLSQYLIVYNEYLRTGKKPTFSNREKALYYDYLFGDEKAIAYTMEVMRHRLVIERLDGYYNYCGNNTKYSAAEVAKMALCPMCGCQFKKKNGIPYCAKCDIGLDEKGGGGEWAWCSRIAEGGENVGRQPNATYLRLACYGIKPGNSVAILGAGFGNIIPTLAKLVGREGQLFVVDYNCYRLDFVRKLINAEGYTNVHSVDGHQYADTMKEANLDAVVAIGEDAPLHGAFLKEIMDSIKPGGQLLFAEAIDFTLNHGYFTNFSPDFVKKHYADSGLELVTSIEPGPECKPGAYAIMFRKP